MQDSTELSTRDRLRARLRPKELKGWAVARSDVGKIFVLVTGQAPGKVFATIVDRERFLTIPVMRIVLWDELDDFDINIDEL